MRQLLNTLFVLREDAYLTLENENVVVRCDDETLGRYPLHILQGILCFSYKGASPALMGACADRGVSLAFYTPRGRFLSQVCGETCGNVLLRKQQYRVSDDTGQSARYASCMLVGKVYNARWVLERATRDHPMRVDVPQLKQVSGNLAGICQQILSCGNLETLRGLEGAAATQYFSVFNQLILQNNDEFIFEGRNRRPPMDRVNAMLSFTYSLLRRECTSSLEGVGLDPYVGFMHRDRAGRESLALDLMEELRPCMADRFVLSLINGKLIQAQQFDEREDGAVLLNEDGRKVLLTAWQARKQDVMTHPFLEEKIPWGLVPYVQALLLARTLRGDVDGYPAFLWK